VHFKVRGELTGGSFAIVEHPIEPGVLVDPHTHRNEDELSYVLKGTIWARVGDQEIEATAGSYVWKPRGILHTFWNSGPEPARILEVISPAGFERLFEQVAELLEHPTETTEADVYELCRQYGLTFDRTWLPDLESRFGPMRIV
jgi:quercetin dioxygenase-like cupin family protein